MSEIRKVAVIGAGTMGSGIASHLANAGVSVYLFDVPSDSADDRSEIARQAITRQLKSKPPAFMHPDCAELITFGNMEDDLHLVSEVDWIAEAVVERLEVKESLYREIEKYRKPGTPISSNTSTIPLSLLSRNMPESFSRDFCITHFFNPVRYMRLLEIVRGETTRAEVISQLTEFCDMTLGKGVVSCKDTPGFLGNRVGVYAIQVAIIEAMRLGLSVEEADAVLGRPVGWPKTGVFRLYDLIGLDLMFDVLKSMRNVIPQKDPFYHVAAEIPLICNLIDRGYTGNKGLGGFFRRKKSQTGSLQEVVDLQTGNYRPLEKPSSIAQDAVAERGLQGLLELPSIQGRYAWRVLSQTLTYAASLVPEVSDHLVPIDEAMKLGFGWTRGPFEMIDELGAEWLMRRLEAEKTTVPPLLQIARVGPFYRDEKGCLQHLTIHGEYQNVERPAGVIRLTDRTKTSKPLLRNSAASLWEIGDGVACFEFHTKANALLPQSMELLEEAIDVVHRDYKSLIIHNDGPHFSVGVNIQNVLDNAKRQAWSDIEKMLVDFQRTCLKLKYSSFPTVGAPGGMSLGGGFEVLLHCDALVAHANTVTGLVETQVGLIPSGGGCKEMLFRRSKSAPEPVDMVTDVFRIIGPAKTASSPQEAESLMFMLSRDKSIMNRDRILAAAKNDSLKAAENYEPPKEISISAAGPAGLSAIDKMMFEWKDKGILRPHDLAVGKQLAGILCGGDANEGEPLTEHRLLDLEREAFMTLVKTPETIARIEHTLSTGKPLRN